VTWPYALLLVGVGLVVLVIGRLAMSNPRRCTGTVTAVKVRRGMTGSPPYVPLIHRTATIRYCDHTGQEHTFRYEGGLRLAVGDTVTVAHRRHRPQLPRVVPGPHA
jgi:hypothetical protein